MSTALLRQDRGEQPVQLACRPADGIFIPPCSALTPAERAADMADAPGLRIIGIAYSVVTVAVASIALFLVATSMHIGDQTQLALSSMPALGH